MPRSTTLGAGPSAPLVPNLGAIKILVQGLEENRKYRLSLSEDGVKAPQWVQIRDEVPHYKSIEGQLKAMGYIFSHGHKKWRVWRDVRQDSPTHLSPDLHKDDKPRKEKDAAAGASSSGVPFVKRPFEWEIHGSANLATFCCVLRVTWCHRVCFLCYLRQNGGTINVSKFEVLASCLFPHIRCCSVEPGANLPNFTHRFTQHSHKFKTVNFVRMSYEFRTNWPPFCLDTVLCRTHWILNNLFCRSLDKTLRSPFLMLCCIAY